MALQTLNETPKKKIPASMTRPLTTPRPKVNINTLTDVQGETKTAPKISLTRFSYNVDQLWLYFSPALTAKLLLKITQIMWCKCSVFCVVMLLPSYFRYNKN